MATINVEAPTRPELASASDEAIADAIAYADPMVLRGLLYQLTGDPELEAIEVQSVMNGFYEIPAPVREEDIALLRR